MAKTLFRPVSYALSQLLGDIDLGKLALPELQRPFVWQKAGIRGSYRRSRSDSIRLAYRWFARAFRSELRLGYGDRNSVLFRRK